MGNFSRDPSDRLTDSIAKHYVGVRMQQGVPLLDTDWNELEDLRKHELESLMKQFIGDGVPAGNDGFRIEALAGGGVGTIVLQSTIPAEGPSSLEIDFSNPTAASALGFLPGKSFSQRLGSSPARLTGNAAEPFELADGMAFTVVANGEAGEMVTFVEADFADISQATATEVVAAINAVLTRASAEVGAGNDFIIRGGAGSLENAGRLLVGGREVLNEADLVYTSQPLFENSDLAAQWGVDIIEDLKELAGTDRTDLVYIDVWEREVGPEEDDALILPEVGIETTVRLKREWAIRVAEDATDLSGITQISGHQYLPLARLDRKGADGERIPEERITDLRKRQLTLADVVVSPILVKGPLGLDKVNSGLFANMLRTTSRVYRDLLESDYFLAVNFCDITAVESVKVLRAFQDVRTLAESGITDASLKRLDNQAALDHLRRLYQAQRGLVDAMLELTPGNSQRAGTEILLNLLDTWLEGDNASIPGLRRSVMPGESPDLGDAYEAQIFINSEIGRRAGVLPQGLLGIQFVSAPGGPIGPGTSNELVYSIRSDLNVDETIELALTDTQGVFQFAFKDLDEDPNHPGDPSRAVLLLEEEQTANVALDLIVPGSVAVGTQSRIVLAARSQLNPDEVDFANVEIMVTVGSPIILPAADLLLELIYPPINLATDVCPVGRFSDGKNVVFQLDVKHLVPESDHQEFVFTVEFIGNAESFKVRNTAVLNPSLIPGALRNGDIVPFPVNIDVQATDAAADGQESLMVIRLSKTDPAPPEPFFRELHIRVVTDIPE